MDPVDYIKFGRRQDTLFKSRKHNLDDSQITRGDIVLDIFKNAVVSQLIIHRKKNTTSKKM